jgi:hypothetical protein
MRRPVAVQSAQLGGELTQTVQAMRALVERFGTDRRPARNA